MDEASAHLTRIGASSRGTGSSGAANAREYCAEVLTRLGFAVRECSFEYSDVAGALAAPMAGVVVALAALGFYAGQIWRPAGPITGVVLVVALAALGRLGNRGVLDFPFRRKTGVNLEAVRGATEPTVWLVAHIDSKWQPVSMIARVCGVVASAVGLASLALLDVAPSVEARGVGAALVVATWLAALPLMMSFVGTRNHGTLDNASGVAAVLAAAAQLPVSARVGVLITDAEELALAGARAWVRSRAGAANASGVAINCDSVDDAGPLVLMYTGAAPSRLIARMKVAASDLGELMRVLRLIPGILTDSVALADGGWETLTLSRGTARTLQRIHTGRDTLEHMRGTGISGAAAVMARVAAEVSGVRGEG